MTGSVIVALLFACASWTFVWRRNRGLLARRLAPAPGAYAVVAAVVGAASIVADRLGAFEGRTGLVPVLLFGFAPIGLLGAFEAGMREAAGPPGRDDAEASVSG